MWIATGEAALTIFDQTRLAARREDEVLHLSVSGGPQRLYSWQVYDCGPALGVFVNGVRLSEGEWLYGARSRVLTVPGLPGPELELEVVLQPETREN
jgi:hypothetical protein